jgi:hypothetical protein
MRRKDEQQVVVENINENDNAEVYSDDEMETI